MMKESSEKGFILFYLIALIALMSTSLLILTRISSNMAYQSDKAYLDASLKNLEVSAKSWVALHHKQLGQNSPSMQRRLDCNDFQISNPPILIRLSDSKDKAIHIDYQCSYRKWNREKTLTVFENTTKSIPIQNHVSM